MIAAGSATAVAVPEGDLPALLQDRLDGTGWRDFSGLDDLLRPAETAILRRLRPRSARAFHEWLLANPSAAGAGMRRDLLLRLRERAPMAAPEDAPSGDAPGAAPHGSPMRGPIADGEMDRGGGHDSGHERLDEVPPPGSAAPGEGWLDPPHPDFTALPPAALAALSIPAPRAFDMAEPLRAGWPVRSQQRRPNCVAQASLACLELLRARGDGAEPSYLSPTFLYAAMRKAASPPLPAGWATGATKLRQAAEALRTLGVPPETVWPDTKGAAEEPDPATVAAAAVFRPVVAMQHDWRSPRPAPEGVARLIYAELEAGRPVAIAVPEFGDPANPGPTDWHRRGVIDTGEVPDPFPWARPVPGIGHAVCVTGFQPSDRDPLGGYFVFRNSWGTLWAPDAPVGEAEDPPIVPEPGYGTISASYVEAFCWEAASFRPPPG